jgi:hypothetical protein
MQWVPRNFDLSCEAGGITRAANSIRIRDQFPPELNCPEPTADFTQTVLCSGTPCKDIPGALDSVVPATSGDVICVELANDVVCDNVATASLNGQPSFFNLAPGFGSNVTVQVRRDYSTGQSFTDVLTDSNGSPC